MLDLWKGACWGVEGCGEAEGGRWQVEEGGEREGEARAGRREDQVDRGED